MTLVTGPSVSSEEIASDQTTQRAPKIIWVDALKGIGIILVVFGHALRGAYGRDLLPVDFFQSVDTRIYSFHMPLFFVASGLFLRQTIARTTPLGFLRILVERILYPLVLWTYVFLLFKYAAGELANNPINLEEVFVLPFPGREHLWFLWTLLLVQFVVFLAHQGFPHIPAIPFALGLLALGLILCHLETPKAWLPWIGNTIYNLPFLAFGLLIGTQVPKLSVPVWLGFLFLALCLGIIWIVPSVDLFFISPLLIISLLGCVTIAFQKTSLMRGLAVLGKASMAIYLTHTILSAGCREIMLALGMADPIMQLSITTLVGLFGGLAIYRIAHRFGISRWLGFR